MKVTASKKTLIILVVSFVVILLLIPIAIIRARYGSIYNFFPLYPREYSMVGGYDNCQIVKENLKERVYSCNGFLKKIEETEEKIICYEVSMIEGSNAQNLNSCEDKGKITIEDYSFGTYEPSLPINVELHFKTKFVYRQPVYSFDNAKFSKLSDEDLVFKQKDDGFVFSEDQKYETDSDREFKEKNYYFIYSLKDIVGNIVSIADVNIDKIGVNGENVYLDIKGTITGVPVTFRVLAKDFLDSRMVDSIDVGVRVNTSNYSELKISPQESLQVLLLFDGSEGDVDKILNELVSSNKNGEKYLELKDLKLYSIYGYGL